MAEGVKIYSSDSRAPSVVQPFFDHTVVVFYPKPLQMTSDGPGRSLHLWPPEMTRDTFRRFVASEEWRASVVGATTHTDVSHVKGMFEQ